ncbi:Arf GTPase activating protein domain-containing protein [Rozella allomycis CSF55]|uniref:Arf GTPase activating protein domain-containing protein n=1 Tax=Rozella allomycis (strain CSF55) TaxID=988480 RepID=A0A075B079_ROZAC|nr:Arf GTPase activating protein domain-containing protein [Rozella allomycis CSF55]|eukprot:EPZ35780.1 Arf GTPase activating protein domain-containing protein [Rozella allomycis CSF55]
MNIASLFVLDSSERFSINLISVFNDQKHTLDVSPLSFRIVDCEAMPTISIYQNQFIEIPDNNLSIKVKFRKDKGIKKLMFVHTVSGDQLHDLLYTCHNRKIDLIDSDHTILLSDPNDFSKLDYSKVVSINNDESFEWNWMYSPLDRSNTNVCTFLHFNEETNEYEPLSTLKDAINLRDESDSELGASIDNLQLVDDITGHSRESFSKQNIEVAERKQAVEDAEFDDGPVFRATVQQMEKRTSALKQNMKRIIKSLQSMIDIGRQFDEAEIVFIDAIGQMSSLVEAHSYLLKYNQKYGEIRRNYFNQMQALLLDPLKRLYEADIKNADPKRKDYQQESDEYYSFLSKYLSMKSEDKKRSAYDQKYHNKKSSFDLKRFEYFSYMQDLHGRKEQEILYYISAFEEKKAQFHHRCSIIFKDLEQDLQTLTKHVDENTKNMVHQLKEREEKRKLLETRILTNGIASPLTPSHNIENVFDEEENKFKGFRDLEYHDHNEVTNQGRRKEGFLYIFRNGPPGTTGHWKKLWCVVSGGQLQEYTNWKENMRIHTSYDLRFSTVREARNTERRFCFELISPQFKRVFQATSQEEMLSWIHVISNAIESLLNGTSSQDNLAHLANSNHELNHLNIENLQITPLDNILQELRDIDQGNLICADCGAKNPDWASINLGILLCIECSGIHRSLGSHISKVRSFTLDTQSWTPSVIQYMKSMGNTRFNSIYEGTLPPCTKPSPADRRELKNRYILAKYIDLAFSSDKSLMAYASEDKV